NVFGGEELAKTGAWILRRPLALHDRDHRELFVRHTVVLHVPQHRQREHRRRTDDAVRRFELPRERRAAATAAEVACTDARSTALAVRDQDRLAQTLLNRRDCVTYVDH